MVEIAELLEITMILSFGVSWPLNVIKSYKARTTKGKSLGFLLLIFLAILPVLLPNWSMRPTWQALGRSGMCCSSTA